MTPDIIIFLLACGLFFLIGWDAAARYYHRRQTRLAATQASLAAQLDDLAARFAADPYRAAIGTGQEYIINRIENLTALLRRDLPHTKD